MWKFFGIPDKTGEKINRILFNTLVVVCLLIFVISMVGKYRPELVMSNSMYPVLEKGDLILARRFDTDKDEVIIGDIYTYKNPDTVYTVTHRCIDIESLGDDAVYVFKGDNNKKEDKIRVRKDWIKYKVVQ